MHRFKINELFEIWVQSSDKSDKITAVFDYIKRKFRENINPSEEQKIREKVRRLCRNFNDRWCTVSRHKDRFENRYSSWLKEHFIVEIGEPTPSTSSGRPRLSFSEKTPRSQRREASQLAHEVDNSSALIIQAAEIVARKEKKTDLVAVLQEINRSPTRPAEIRKKIGSPEKQPQKYTPEEALELILNSNLSKQTYLDLRQGALRRNCDIYPDYKRIWKCKSACRPQGITVTDIVAEVPLRNLLEHTVQRLIRLQEQVIEQHMESMTEKEMNTELICSYGFDGSSGHSMYKQGYSTSGSHSDASLFATTLIPLRLQTESVILWNNRTPQSIRFCRPIKLEYVKETSVHILREKSNLDKEIENLQEFKISLANGKIINVKYNLRMTLIDGKVLNVLTNTKSSQSCPICGATPKQFLEVKDFKTTKIFTPKPNTLNYGISPLHSWIRFFECILHISYRCDIQEWQIRGAENKKRLNDKKKLIQERFFTDMHLHVDKPKANGFGSTNDGNTARRAFGNTKMFSDITNVDEELIKRFKIILICLSCQYEIDPETFGEYCFATATVYMSKYPWYPMPATVHKVLIHGKQIMENSLLPVGYFAEEASEARNKLYKHDREHHARKTSREHNLEDVFNRAMDTSDPIISSINMQKRASQQHKVNLPSEVINMLLQPNADTSFEETEEADEETEDLLDEVIPARELDQIELENDM